MARSRSSMALGLGLLAWIALLFSPLAFVQTVNAESDVENYGTVIGIVSTTLAPRKLIAVVAAAVAAANLLSFRIWAQPTPASV